MCKHTAAAVLFGFMKVIGLDPETSLRGYVSFDALEIFAINISKEVIPWDINAGFFPSLYTHIRGAEA
jgi:hypothetical protein